MHKRKLLIASGHGRPPLGGLRSLRHPRLRRPARPPRDAAERRAAHGHGRPSPGDRRERHRRSRASTSRSRRSRTLTPLPPRPPTPPRDHDAAARARARRPAPRRRTRARRQPAPEPAPAQPQPAAPAPAAAAPAATPAPAPSRRPAQARRGDRAGSPPRRSAAHKEAADRVAAKKDKPADDEPDRTPDAPTDGEGRQDTTGSDPHPEVETPRRARPGTPRPDRRRRTRHEKRRSRRARRLLPHAGRRAELLHRPLPHPALPPPDLPGRRHPVRRALGGPRRDQRDRDRLRAQPQRLERRRARVDAVHARDLGSPTASTPTRTPSATPSTRSTRSSPPRGTSRPPAPSRTSAARSGPTTTPTGTSTTSCERAQVIAGIPTDLVSSLSGLTQGHFPVAARATYDDQVTARRREARSRRARTPPARSSPTQNRTGIDVHARAGSAVIAVRDGEIVSVGHTDRLGSFVRLRDAYGNVYTYGHLKKVSDVVPVPKQRARARRASSASSGWPRRTPSPHPRRDRRPPDEERPRPGAAAQTASAAKKKERLFANPRRPAAWAAGGRYQLQTRGTALPEDATMARYFTSTTAWTATT